MQAFQELLTTDIGLMSLVVIAITLGMGVFYVRYFLRHIQQDAAKAAADARH